MIVIRGCQGQDELEACVQLQIETWGYDPTDVIPRKAFLVWQKVGGQVIGAFDSELPNTAPEGAPGSLIGFVLALPGIKSYAGGPAPYLHSHMMAVRDGYRDRGLGRRLKLAQREDALDRGIHLIEWTFDPLEIKNSYLNFAKLGAITRRYKHDFYGNSSSPLHGGLPTDRIFAEWWLNSDRVCRVLAGESPVILPTEHVEVPAELADWKSSDEDRPKARAVQAANADALESAFARGLAVIGYERTPQGDGRFLLGQWDEPLGY